MASGRDQVPPADRSPSEYEGGGVLPNTIYPKGADALTPSDKLRLMSITGQTEDPLATPDPGYWNGNEYFVPGETPPPDPQRVARDRRNANIERNRYKETPRPSQY
jgi:hypothetical protein